MIRLLVSLGALLVPILSITLGIGSSQLGQVARANTVSTLPGDRALAAIWERSAASTIVVSPVSAGAVVQRSRASDAATAPAPKAEAEVDPPKAQEATPTRLPRESDTRVASLQTLSTGSLPLTSSARQVQVIRQPQARTSGCGAGGCSGGSGGGRYRGGRGRR